MPLQAGVSKMEIEKINHELRNCTNELQSLTSHLNICSSLCDKIDEETDLASRDLICPFMKVILKKIFVLFSAGTTTLDEFKGQLLSVITGGPLIAMENHEKLESLFNQLMNELLTRTLKKINWQSPIDPAPQRVHLMLKHYAALRGLRARVREDMTMFVEIYNRSNKVPQSSTDQSSYRRFFEDFAAIDSKFDCNHSNEIKMMLREMGEDIMRRVLIMGLHLLQLLQLWSERDDEKRTQHKTA